MGGDYPYSDPYGGMDPSMMGGGEMGGDDLYGGGEMGGGGRLPTGSQPQRLPDLSRRAESIVPSVYLLTAD